MKKLTTMEEIEIFKDMFANGESINPSDYLSLIFTIEAMLPFVQNVGDYSYEKDALKLLKRLGV